MIGLILALVLAVGVGGTVQVADSARPGETLFGVDQAVENLRLKIANKERESELRVEFAKERVSEIEEILAEKSETENDVELENEESIEVQKSEDDSKEEEEIKIGVEAALNLLAGVEDADSESTTTMVEQLNSFIAGLPEGASVEVEGNKLKIEFKDEATGEETKVKYDIKNDRLKTEIRSEDEKIKIEMKNGSLEIKTKVESDEDEESKSGLEEAEAKVFLDKTIVEMEVGDQKTTFTTSATTRAAIIAAIIAQVPGLTTAEVEAVLKIEAEDQDEEEGDQLDDKDNDDSSDDEEEDEDGKDEDGDDDDRSGSNSGSN